MSNLRIYRSMCTINTSKLQNIFRLPFYDLCQQVYQKYQFCQRMTKDGNLPSVYIEACRETLRVEILC